MIHKIFLTFLTLFHLYAYSQTSFQWSEYGNIAESSIGNNHPRIVVNRLGNPVVLWGKGSDASAWISTWDGSKFSSPIKISGQYSIATASWMGPDIASFGDTIYVVMKQTPEDLTSSHILLTTSFDGGKSFAKPIRVDQIGDSISRFPTVATDLNGQPIVGFMKFNSSFGESRWVVTRSEDFGLSFKVDIKASGWGSSTDVCDCCPGVVNSVDNHCVVIYRDNNKNIRDSWMALSNDLGKTFIGGCNVDKNNWIVNSCPASGPDGFIFNDKVYSVFMNAASGKTLNYLSQSSVSSLSLEEVIKVPSVQTGLNGQNYPRIDHFNSSAAVVWRQDVNNRAQLPIMFIPDLFDLKNFRSDTVDLLDITNADVALNSQKVFVVWQDDNSRTIKYRFANYKIISNINNNESQSIILETSPNPFQDYLKCYSNIQNGKVFIVNSLGQEIYWSTFSTNLEISTALWPPGKYLVKLISDNRLISKTIQKF